MVGDMLENVKRKYSNQLQNTGKADFEGSAFELSALTSVKSDLLFDKLPVRHLAVANHCVNAVVDLDPIVASL